MTWLPPLLVKWFLPAGVLQQRWWCDVERAVWVTMSLTKSQLIVKWGCSPSFPEGYCEGHCDPAGQSAFQWFVIASVQEWSLKEQLIIRLKKTHFPHDLDLLTPHPHGFHSWRALFYSLTPLPISTTSI